MELMNKTKKTGFTLIELVIVTILIVMMTTLMLTNYRQGEKSRRVGIAVDEIIGALTATQNNALTGKATTNTTGSCRIPVSYYITFNYSTQYTMYALNNCGSVDTIETFSLPQNIRIQAAGLVSGAPVGSNLSISFTPPYGVLMLSRDNGAFNTFQTATITLESTDGSISHTVTVDGISGRIGN
jgi:Tfp pilus assembly protein FimT